MGTFRKSQIESITLRTADSPKLRELRIIAPVSVRTEGGGIVHALLCRALRVKATEVNVRSPPLYLVYYDRDGDEMVVLDNVSSEQVGWLSKIGGV